MMIVSDVVTLQDRGKYQGILGSMVGLGNATGPLIAAGFALHLTWRGLFYLIAPLAMVSFAASWIWLPSTMPKQNLKETLAKIDVLGLLFGTAAVILLLIPISDGGHSGTPWDSPMIIAMFVVGGLCLVIFLLIEWRWADLPMMPLSMFRNPSVAAMLGQSFLLGMSYYSYIYFLPLYFQNVRGETPLIAACLQLPLVVAQTIASTAAGFYVSYFGRYLEVIYSGFAIWTLGGGLLVMADRTISLGLVSLYLAIIGIGTGFVFQPTLVALQAQCPKAQRAVVTSNRNFIRSAGGAVGLAVSSAILSNVLKGSLPERLEAVANSVFVAPNLANYPVDDANAISGAYANASRAVFIFCVPLAGIAFLLSAFIKDRGLVRQEEREEVAASQGTPRTSDVEKGEGSRDVGYDQAQAQDDGDYGKEQMESAPMSRELSQSSLKSQEDKRSHH
jgi:MFS family permease